MQHTVIPETGREIGREQQVIFPRCVRSRALTLKLSNNPDREEAMKYLRRLMLAGLGLTLTLAMGVISAPGDATAQGWEPKKPVEFVIMAGKGGGADRLAPFFSGIIGKKKLFSKPVVSGRERGGEGKRVDVGGCRII